MNQIRRLRRVPVAVLVAGVSLGLPSVADASLEVRLVNGAHTVTCADNTACDGSAETGNLTLANQSIGGYLFNLTIGVSKPLIGAADQPQLQLTDLSLTPFGSASGPLSVFISDSGFTGPTGPTPYQFAAAGTATAADVWFRAYADMGNSLFGTGSLMGELGPLSGPSFSGTRPVSWAGPTSPYAITLAAQINPLGSGLSLTSVSAQLTPVPLPAAGMLFGIGLIGLLGVAGRRGVDSAR